MGREVGERVRDTKGREGGRRGDMEKNAFQTWRDSLTRPGDPGANR